MFSTFGNELLSLYEKSRSASNPDPPALLANRTVFRIVASWCRSNKDIEEGNQLSDLFSCRVIFFSRLALVRWKVRFHAYESTPQLRVLVGDRMRGLSQLRWPCRLAVNIRKRGTYLDNTDKSCSNNSSQYLPASPCICSPERTYRIPGLAASGKSVRLLSLPNVVYIHGSNCNVVFPPTIWLPTRSQTI